MNQESLINTLLIEDDAKLASLTKQYLENHNVLVTIISDGHQGMQEALRFQYDIILLDIMLPNMSGIEICQQIRARSDIPIIMLTARNEEADRVMGLEIGADDYISKPFSPRELLARIHAIIRRTRNKVGPRQETLHIGNLILDPQAYSATIQNEALDLTTYEFSLLYSLVKQAGRVLSREQLLDQAKGSAEEAFDRSIDVHISKLRQKLGDDANHPVYIKTIRGIGYQFIKDNK